MSNLKKDGNRLLKVVRRTKRLYERQVRNTQCVVDTIECLNELAAERDPEKSLLAYVKQNGWDRVFRDDRYGTWYLLMSVSASNEWELGAVFDAIFEAQFHEDYPLSRKDGDVDRARIWRLLFAALDGEDEKLCTLAKAALEPLSELYVNQEQFEQLDNHTQARNINKLVDFLKAATNTDVAQQLIRACSPALPRDDDDDASDVPGKRQRSK